MMMMIRLCIPCSYKQGSLSVDKDSRTCNLPRDPDTTAGQEIPESGRRRSRSARVAVKFDNLTSINTSINTD